MSAGIRILRNMACPELIESNPEDIKSLIGEKAWRSHTESLVSNSFRSDLHFLPSDAQESAFSGVAAHSLVLFRYPLTAPVEIFECAQDVSLVNWPATLARIARIKPMANTFVQEKPIKRIRLVPRYLADLLTRYVAIYIRIGSPDFSEKAVSRLAKEIG